MNDECDSSGAYGVNDFYPCAGICRVDPESGYCIGCGRPVFLPPPSDPGPVAEKSPEQQSSADPRKNPKAV